MRLTLKEPARSLKGDVVALGCRPCSTRSVVCKGSCRSCSRLGPLGDVSILPAGIWLCAPDDTAGIDGRVSESGKPAIRATDDFCASCKIKVTVIKAGVANHRHSDSSAIIAFRRLTQSGVDGAAFLMSRENSKRTVRQRRSRPRSIGGETLAQQSHRGAAPGEILRQDDPKQASVTAKKIGQQRTAFPGSLRSPRCGAIVGFRERSQRLGAQSWIRHSAASRHQTRRRT